MEQLKLFDMMDDVQYAMSLTSAELPKIKQANIYSYYFIRDIRNAVHRKMHMDKMAQAQYEHDINRIYR
jgi:hypothetical protein